MRVLLVVNPRASSTTARRRRDVERALAHHELEVQPTRGRGHAAELARGAADAGVGAVVVLGGDGTLNEAAGSLAGTATALAPLPGGSTNVFTRTLGYPRSLQGAVPALVADLEAGSTRRIGIGRANGRIFLFHLGAGFDAAVVARMERRPAWVKRWAAHPVFAWSAIVTYFGCYDRRRAAFRVTADAESADGGSLGDGFFAIVSNSSPYTYFGPRPLRVTDAAAFGRGLAVTMFLRLGFRDLVPSALEAMGGGLRRRDSVLQRADLDHVSFAALGAPFSWQVDGEHIGEVERLAVRYEPDALEVVVPRSPLP